MCWFVNCRLVFKKKNIKRTTNYVINTTLIIVGILSLLYGYWLGVILIGFGLSSILKLNDVIPAQRAIYINMIISVLAIVFLLAEYWRPLGVDRNIFWNLIFVGILCFGLLGVFTLFRKNYSRILQWALDNKIFLNYRYIRFFS